MSGQEIEGTFDITQVYDCENANQAIVEFTNIRTRTLSQASNHSKQDHHPQDDDDIDALLNDLRKLVNSSTGGTKKNPSIRTHLPLGKVEERNRLLDLLEKKIENLPGCKSQQAHVERANKEVQVDTLLQHASGDKLPKQKESQPPPPPPSFAQVNETLIATSALRSNGILSSSTQKKAKKWKRP
ncbi:hypothetical protein AVEN_61391-1 [Araneus ventricosus]|uniref:Uncharacterized protein n=1 Tax=Araneus ventricosus TaxID=182803 RepID=A0A4Y2QGD4_ARAVE|nr:hypothetical protein AVEN_61391-1 [Araneus ventricosus]